MDIRGAMANRARERDMFAYETIDGHNCFAGKLDNDSDEVYGKQRSLSLQSPTKAHHSDRST